VSAAFRADLLSDTLTRPTDGMRAAMAAAEVGDDVFGEDPTVNALEAEVADRLGHEAGLFTPSGSMANQLGLRLHVKPGEELVCDSLAHVVRAELGAAAVFSGISSRTWVAPRGLLSAADPLALMITGAGAYQVNTALVVVENTHNFGGGTVQPIDEIRLLRKGTQERGVNMHLDGARLWNAHVASGVALADYGREFDTVSVCLSKGLGAPVGSVLVGSVAAMAEARIWRKRYGGGMRQVGILAAAGLVALSDGPDGMIERLAEDHVNARRLAEGLAELDGVVSAGGSAQPAPGRLDPDRIRTNFVMFKVERDRAAFLAALRARGVEMVEYPHGQVRAVTHYGVTAADIETTIVATRAALADTRPTIPASAAPEPVVANA
jgi:threonine aldolase